MDEENANEEVEQPGRPEPSQPEAPPPAQPVGDPVSTAPVAEKGSERAIRDNERQMQCARIYDGLRGLLGEGPQLEAVRKLIYDQG